MMVFTVESGVATSPPPKTEISSDSSTVECVADLNKENKEVFLKTLNKTLANIHDIKLNRANNVKKTDLLKRLSDPADNKAECQNELQPSSHTVGYFPKKYSNRCLIVFTLVSVLLVVMCSLLTVVLTTNLLIKSTNSGEISETLLSKVVSKLSNKNKNSSGSIQLERNAFNWIREQLKNVYGQNGVPPYSHFNGNINENNLNNVAVFSKPGFSQGIKYQALYES